MSDQNEQQALLDLLKERDELRSKLQAVREALVMVNNCILSECEDEIDGETIQEAIKQIGE